MLVVPNRVDLPTMMELEKALGGKGRVAWMLEHSLMPGKAIMDHLMQIQPTGFTCSLNQQGRDYVLSKIRQYIESGRHVVLLPGRPLQAPASLTDIPAHLLTLFDGSPLHAIPVYVGMYNNYFDAAITTREPYDRLHLTFCTPLRAGHQLGARIQAAWMNAQTAQLAQHPMLEHPCLPTGAARGAWPSLRPHRPAVCTQAPPAALSPGRRAQRCPVTGEGGTPLSWVWSRPRVEGAGPQGTVLLGASPS